MINVILTCMGVENVFLDGHPSGSQRCPPGLNFSEKMKPVFPSGAGEKLG